LWFFCGAQGGRLTELCTLPSSFPFQPETGSHTAILISESLDGRKTAATRQKGGKSAYPAAASFEVPGGRNAPAATCRALVIAACGKAGPDRLSHPAAKQKPAFEAAKMNRNNCFMQLRFGCNGAGASRPGLLEPLRRKSSILNFCAGEAMLILLRNGMIRSLCYLLAPLATLAQVAPPYVQEGKTRRVSSHVWVIPDGRVNLVPNVGIIVGSESTLVVDSGMGPRNGEVTLREVRKVSSHPQLYLTSTHFHPEHVSGFQAFPAGSRLIRPAVQQEELLAKSAGMIEMFSKMSPAHAELLKPVKPRIPDLTFGNFVELRLGGLTVRIFTVKPAHTDGDNFVWVKEDGVLFCGDVVINRFYPIISDHGGSWIEVLDELAKIKPAIVVPGHGEVAGPELIARERAYLVKLQTRSRESKAQGKSAAETVAALSPEIKAAYRDWENPEWIGPGIQRFYAEAPDGQGR
jgi:glyoxylase-like metal-dependent hydrolase (beta-lactamase superfamily II)